MTTSVTASETRLCAMARRSDGQAGIRHIARSPTLVASLDPLVTGGNPIRPARRPSRYWPLRARASSRSASCALGLENRASSR